MLETKVNLYPVGYDLDIFKGVTPNSLNKRGGVNFVFNNQTKQLTAAAYPASHEELLSLQGWQGSGVGDTSIASSRARNKTAFRPMESAQAVIDREVLKYFVIGSFAPYKDRTVIATWNAMGEYERTYPDVEGCLNALIKKFPQLNNPQTVVVLGSFTKPMPLDYYLGKVSDKPEPTDGFYDHTIAFNFAKWLKEQV